MTVYVYKSITGLAVNIGSYNITPEPGLQFADPVDMLDRNCGTLLSRYTDGTLDSTDGEDSYSTSAATINLNQGMSGNLVKCTSSSAQNLVIQNDTLGAWIGSSSIPAYQAGTGTPSFSAGSGVTIRGTAPTFTQYKIGSVIRVGPNEWAYL